MVSKKDYKNIKMRGRHFELENLEVLKNGLCSDWKSTEDTKSWTNCL